MLHPGEMWVTSARSFMIRPFYGSQSLLFSRSVNSSPYFTAVFFRESRRWPTHKCTYKTLYHTHTCTHTSVVWPWAADSFCLLQRKRTSDRFPPDTRAGVTCDKMICSLPSTALSLDTCQRQTIISLLFHVCFCLSSLHLPFWSLLDIRFWKWSQNVKYRE